MDGENKKVFVLFMVPTVAVGGVWYTIVVQHFVDEKATVSACILSRGRDVFDNIFNAVHIYKSNGEFQFL